MNWEDALREVCREYINRPLAWGSRDCCQFAAAYVKARTGHDHAVDFNYDSKLGAARILAEYGGIESLIASYLGPAHDGNVAGDLVLCNLQVDIDSSVQTLGVSNGTYVLGIHPDDGLVRLPLKSIVRAWSV
jgi:hypothetical protein